MTASPSASSSDPSKTSPGTSRVDDATWPARSSAHVIALSELREPADHGGNTAALDLAVNPLHLVKTTLQVSVGEATITVGELLGAKENHVLVLDRGVDQPVDVLLEGRVVARGDLIAVDDRFAIRITELPVPLQG